MCITRERESPHEESKNTPKTKRDNSCYHIYTFFLDKCRSVKREKKLNTTNKKTKQAQG